MNRRSFLGLLTALVVAPKAILASPKRPRWRMGFGNGKPGPWREGEFPLKGRVVTVPRTVVLVTADGTFEIHAGDPLVIESDCTVRKAAPKPHTGEVFAIVSRHPTNGAISTFLTSWRVSKT